MNSAIPFLRFGAASLAMAALSLALRGQDAPVAPSDENPALAFSASGSFSGKTDVKHDDTRVGQIGVDAWQLGVNGSPFEGLSLGVSYESYRFRSSEGRIPLPERLRSLSLPVTYSREIVGNWIFLAMAAPCFNTAEGEGVLSSDGLGLMTGVGVRWQATPGVALSFGVAYDSMARGSLRVLPIVGIEWGFAHSWSVNVGFPETSLVYAITDSLKLALKLEGTGGTYHVSREPDASVRSGLAGTKLEYYDIRAGLCTTYTVGKVTTLSLSIGQVLNREFDYHRAGYKLKAKGTAPYVGLSATRAF